MLNVDCSIEQDTNNCPAQRVYQIYLQLAKRNYYPTIDSQDSFEEVHLSMLRDRILAKTQLRLAKVIDIQPENHESNLRQTSQWLRANSESDVFNEIKNISKVYWRWLRLRCCSFESTDISQEEMAEHLKRVRADFCKGSFRDLANKFIPQAVGPRTAHVRAIDPLAIHNLVQNNIDTNSTSIMSRVRTAMQKKLDELNVELDNSFK